MTLIPIELVREIILCILDVPSRSDISDEIGSNTKPDWALIQSLTLASKTYRTLTLEAWFRTLYIKSPSDIPHIQVLFPDICIAWTRYVLKLGMQQKVILIHIKGITLC
jgi:hypothetical protein